MPALALSDALPDFGSRARTAPAAPAAKPEAFIEAASAAPSVNMAATIADAVAKAEAAVADQLSAIYEAMINARSVGPVCLDRNKAKALLDDQVAGDAFAHPVKF